MTNTLNKGYPLLGGGGNDNVSADLLKVVQAITAIDEDVHGLDVALAALGGGGSGATAKVFQVTGTPANTIGSDGDIAQNEKGEWFVKKTATQAWEDFDPMSDTEFPIFMYGDSQIDEDAGAVTIQASGDILTAKVWSVNAESAGVFQYSKQNGVNEFLAKGGTFADPFMMNIPRVRGNQLRPCGFQLAAGSFMAMRRAYSMQGTDDDVAIEIFQEIDPTGLTTAPIMVASISAPWSLDVNGNISGSSYAGDITAMALSDALAVISCRLADRNEELGEERSGLMLVVFDGTNVLHSEVIWGEYGDGALVENFGDPEFARLSDTSFVVASRSYLSFDMMDIGDAPQLEDYGSRYRRFSYTGGSLVLENTWSFQLGSSLELVNASRTAAAIVRPDAVYKLNTAGTPTTRAIGTDKILSVVPRVFYTNADNSSRMFLFAQVYDVVAGTLLNTLELSDFFEQPYAFAKLNTDASVWPGLIADQTTGECLLLVDVSFTITTSMWGENFEIGQAMSLKANPVDGMITAKQAKVIRKHVDEITPENANSRLEWSDFNPVKVPAAPGDVFGGYYYCLDDNDSYLWLFKDSTVVGESAWVKVSVNSYWPEKATTYLNEFYEEGVLAPQIDPNAGLVFVWDETHTDPQLNIRDTEAGTFVLNFNAPFSNANAPIYLNNWNGPAGWVFKIVQGSEGMLADLNLAAMFGWMPVDLLGLPSHCWTDNPPGTVLELLVDSNSTLKVVSGPSNRIYQRNTTGVVKLPFRDGDTYVTTVDADTSWVLPDGSGNMHLTGHLIYTCTNPEAELSLGFNGVGGTVTWVGGQPTFATDGSTNEFFFESFDSGESWVARQEGGQSDAGGASVLTADPAFLAAVPSASVDAVGTLILGDAPGIPVSLVGAKNGAYCRILVDSPNVPQTIQLEMSPPDDGALHVFTVEVYNGDPSTVRNVSFRNPVGDWWAGLTNTLVDAGDTTVFSIRYKQGELFEGTAIRAGQNNSLSFSDNKLTGIMQAHLEFITDLTPDWELHRGRTLVFDSPDPITVNLTAWFFQGYSIKVIQKGAGQVTFTPLDGATVVNSQGHTKTAGQWAKVELEVVSNPDNATAVYLLSGASAA